MRKSQSLQTAWPSLVRCPLMMVATMPDFGGSFPPKAYAHCDAPSEMRNQPPATQPKSNKPRSPPRGAISLTELGWTDPIASYSKYAKEELTFLLLILFENLGLYGKSRMSWHQDQCSRVTEFFLFIEQCVFSSCLRSSWPLLPCTVLTLFLPFSVKQFLARTRCVSRN